MAEAFAKGKKPESGPKTTEDAFVESTVRFWTWSQRNLRSLVLILVALGLIVAGVFYFRNFRATVTQRAAVELAQLRGALVGAPDAAIPEFEAFIERFDGTSAAAEAQLLLARLYLDAARPVDAIALLREVDRPIDQPIGFAARQLLAVAHEQNGDLEAALQQYRTLASEARFPFQRRAADAESARLLAELGRFDEAIAILTRIAAASEDPAEAGEYRLRLGEIRARMAATG